jgi:DNA-binding cell septation regulator SpoVG
VTGAEVSHVKLTRVRGDLPGVVGFVTFRLGPLTLDGLVLRRTRSGCLTLAFPVRTDSSGRRHPLFRPTCDRARREIEAAVLSALGLQEDDQ